MRVRKGKTNCSCDTRGIYIYLRKPLFCAEAVNGREDIAKAHKTDTQSFGSAQPERSVAQKEC